MKEIEEIFKRPRPTSWNLNRIKRICKRIGFKQNFKAIHVAGTNGKGSTSAALFSILSKKFKVGLYTSPHLIKPNERIRTNDGMIKNAELKKYIKMIKNAESQPLSFFEFITCIAFKYFQDKKIDIAIVEVGMGGRLDATNIITPDVEIITNIDYDHMHYLGRTIASIASEKAGIIKKGLVISSARRKAARRIIERISQTKKVRLMEIGRNFFVRNVKVSLNGTSFTLNGKNYETNLIGVHQAYNVSDAIIASRMFVDENTIKDGIKKISWPGRFQIFGRIIFDGAHNTKGINMLVKTLKKLRIKPVFVVAIFKDKQYDVMVKKLASYSNKFIFTKSDSPRACDPNELSRFARGAVEPSFGSAISKALSITNGYVVITGSLHNFHHLQKFIKKKKFI